MQQGLESDNVSMFVRTRQRALLYGRPSDPESTPPRVVSKSQRGIASWIILIYIYNVLITGHQSTPLAPRPPS